MRHVSITVTLTLNSGIVCVTPSTCLNLDTMKTKHPLFGFMPRKVTAKQVRGAIVRTTFSFRFAILTSLQEGNENPFTCLPHSNQYFKILAARKKLPVYAQMEEFYEMVSPALSFVREGAIEPAPQVAPGIKAMCR